MVRLSIALATCVVILGSPTAARAQVTFQGTATFQWVDSTLLKKPAGGQKYPLPKDTKIELRSVGLATTSSVAITKITDDKGSYSFPPVNPKPNDKYRIRIYLSTLRSNPDKKEDDVYRVHGHGYGLTGTVAHEFYLESKNFDAKRAMKGSSTIDCHFGVVDDKDGQTADGYLLQEFGVNDLIKVDEAYAARYAATVVVLDRNYQDIQASGKISWWDELPEPGLGLRFYSPVALAYKGSGGITIPHGAIHALSIMITGDNLDAATASHEFGHFVHYHTTHWLLTDFVKEAETFGHWISQNSNQKVAYAEGFAEFYSAVWMRQFADTLVVPDASSLGFPAGMAWDPWIDPEAQPKLKPEHQLYFGFFWKGGPKSDPYLFKSPPLDGTKSSGETVEGAVAQALFPLRDSTVKAPNAPAAIEPVWRVLREGTSFNKGKVTYSPMKYMHTDAPGASFYDTYMTVNAGVDSASARQNFRNSCNQRGIVYSRMKFLAYFDGKKPVNITPGKVQWVNPQTVFKLTPMTSDDLKTKEEFGGVVSSAGLFIFDTGDASGTEKERDFADTKTIALSGADLANRKLWKLFDNTLTDGNKYEGGELKAAGGVAGKSLYYVLRGAVLKDQVNKKPDTDSEDFLNGPILGDAVDGKAIDQSGLMSASWWAKLGIIFQVKLDRDRVKLKDKSP